MRKFFVLAVVAALVLAGFLAGSWYQKRHAGEVGGDGGRKVLYYVDPMNPGFKSEKPGKAPCGMDLEPVYADGDGGASQGGGSKLLPGAVTVSPDRQQLIGVRVEEVKKAAVTHTVRTVGRVAADETRVYRLIAATDGWIKRLTSVTTGSVVKKDQLLATYYAPEFLPAVQAYLYKLGSLDRFNMSGTETPEQVLLTEQNVQLDVENLRSYGMSDVQINEIKRDRNLVQEIKMVAPADGFVVARNITNGQRFQKGDEWFKLADLRRVWILADIFENEADYFKPGVVARVVLPNQNREFRATVSDTLPQFDPVSRTMKVRLVVDNPGYVLRPDMFVDVNLPVKLPPAVTVPVDAVLFTGLRKTVYIDMGDGRFEPRDVETGWRQGGLVEIVRGLKPGERVVVSGNFLIDSESRMRASSEEACPAPNKDVVCGMDVDVARAVSAGLMSEYKGKKYYFCSGQCKERFEEHPEQYAKRPVDTSHD